MKKPLVDLDFFASKSSKEEALESFIKLQSEQQEHSSLTTPNQIEKEAKQLVEELLSKDDSPEIKLIRCFKTIEGNQYIRPFTTLLYDKIISDACQKSFLKNIEHTNSIILFYFI